MTKDQFLEALKLSTAKHGRKKELADLLGVDRQTVWLYLNGQRQPSAWRMLIILEWIEKFSKIPQKISDTKHI